MKVKSTILAAFLALCMPLAAQAQNSKNYEYYQGSCDSRSECGLEEIRQTDRFDVNYETEQLNNDNFSQTQRTRTRTRTRSRSSRRNQTYYYLGGNLGVFLPSENGLDTGFGGSFFGGYNFNQYLSTDLEFLFYGGGTDINNLGYNFLGFLANVKGKYPFDQTRVNSAYLFGGAGLGYGRVASTGDVADDLDDRGIDTSEGGFAFQLKAGVGVPVSEKVDVFGQVRYLNISVDGPDGDGFSIDGGVSFKL